MINLIHKRILDFVNYHINIEKDNLAALREQPRLRQFFKLLKNTKLKATRSKWYWIYLLPNILGINKEKTILKA